MPEVHEACGLDVDAMYSVLGALRDQGLIELTGQYPFEEIQVASGEASTILERCEADRIALEQVIVELRFDLLKP